jgi:hypothetical protein
MKCKILASIIKSLPYRYAYFFNHKAQKSFSTAYDNSIGIKAARLWNTLPESVKTLESFKAAPGGFICQFPDRPPVTGYTPPNSNSLLDWTACGGHGVCA